MIDESEGKRTPKEVDGIRGFRATYFSFSWSDCMCNLHKEVIIVAKYLSVTFHRKLYPQYNRPRLWSLRDHRDYADKPNG